MLLQDFVRTLNTTLLSSVETIFPFLIIFSSAVFVFLIGLVVAQLLSYTLVQVVNFLSLEKLVEKIPSYKTLLKESPQSSLTNSLSQLVWWSTILIFIVAALQVVGFKDFSGFESFTSFIPKLLSGSLILLVGIIGAYLTSGLIFALGKLSHFPTPTIISKGIGFVIIVFSVLQALNSFGVSSQTINFLILGTIAASSLAVGLSGKEVLLESWKKFSNSKL